MSDTPKWHLSHYDLWGLSVMTLVALWCLSVMIYLSSYYVCRSWRLSLMTFVALWRLSPIMMFVAHDVYHHLWCLSLMTFVALWRLSPIMMFVAYDVHYDVYHQLWCLSLIRFVAVSSYFVPQVGSVPGKEVACHCGADQCKKRLL